MAEIIRNIAFAKQRFDSTVRPVGNIALMLLPVVTLLAYIASDKRHDQDQRDRALDLMKKFDSKFCAAIGASADWGIICNWCLRLFDVAGHDIAQTRAQIDCMVGTLDAVFVNGSVFKELLQPVSGGRISVPRSVVDAGHFPPIAPAVFVGGVDVGFVSPKVVRNLRKQFVFYAGGAPMLL